MLVSQISSKLNHFYIFWILVALAILGTLANLPASYFSYKGNIFNVYFVKMGWLWTTVVYFSRIFVPLHQQKTSKEKQIIRYVLATLLWYGITHFFEVYQHYSGSCSSPDFDTARSCYRAGFFWDGRDISGHTFLLSFASMLLTSMAMERTVHQRDPSQLEIIVEYLTLVIRILWLFMYFTTFVYFHTFADKTMGFLFGLLCFYISENYDKIYSKIKGKFS